MKKVFIDCGANHGQSIDLFINTWDDAKDYEIHSFEANPDFKEQLKAKQDFYKDYDINIYVPMAVWDEDTSGELEFYGKGEHGLASDDKTPKHGLTFRNNLRDFKVDSVSLANIILNNLSEEDYIVLKLDVEGAEYRIIKDLHNKSVLKYIDEFYYEFHGLKKGYELADDIEVINILNKSLKSKPQTWEGNSQTYTGEEVTMDYIHNFYEKKIKEAGKEGLDLSYMTVGTQ